MTRLTLGVRNFLVQTPEVKTLIAAGLIGGGPKFTTWKDGWLFADYPYATIETRSHMALVVFSDGGGWQAPNTHNTGRFSRLLVDVWASPTRDSANTLSVKVQDADLLIETVMDAMRPYLHTLLTPFPTSANVWLWGTTVEVSTHTGVYVLSSEQLGEPVFSDVREGNGARMGRYTFGVSFA